MDELVTRLRKYSRQSVLYLCSTIALILKVWDGRRWDRTHYDLLIRAMFEPIRGDWYRLAIHINQEIVFHRRQLLFLMKLAIQYCPEEGMDVLSEAPGFFGTILLMANDHFHHGLYPVQDSTKWDDREKLTRVLTEFVSVNEYAGNGIENLIVRSHLMMTTYANRLDFHPDYVPIADEYERQTGINLGNHEALTFGVFTKCSLVGLADLQRNAWSAMVKESYFHTTAIDARSISQFFRQLTITPEEFVSRIALRDFGSNDFSVFRDRPLVKEYYGMVPTDVLMVLEKFSSGPYWILSGTSRILGDRLRRFWGAVFEEYVNDQLASGISGSRYQFIPNPRDTTDNNKQICDGVILEDEALVLLEYKASMFTAQAKYSGDHVQLGEEIENKLVHDSASARKKGVEQLASAVKTLLRHRNERIVSKVDLSHVRRVYPLLVTLDPVGSTLAMSRLLNIYFDEFIDRQSFGEITVFPLFCTDIEALETVIPYLNVHGLGGLLAHWLNIDPKLIGTLLAALPKGLSGRRNEMLSTEWSRLATAMEKTLFPNG